jgi:hypothetical protein
MADQGGMAPAPTRACASAEAEAKAQAARARDLARRTYVRRSYLTKVSAVMRLCRRLEAGESVADACRDPTMPPRATLMYWLAKEPELGAMVEDAVARAAAVFPQRAPYTYYEPEVAQELLARLEHGRSLAEICAQPDMPSLATVHRWREAHPEFDAAYLRAREAQADRLFDLAWRIACEAGEDEVRTARLKIQAIRWRIAKLAPRKYGTHKATHGEAGEASQGPQEVVFRVRRFEVAPGRRMVEITDHIAGRHPEDVAAFRAAIRDGRLAHDALDAWAWPEPGD